MMKLRVFLLGLTALNKLRLYVSLLLVWSVSVLLLAQRRWSTGSQGLRDVDIGLTPGSDEVSDRNRFFIHQSEADDPITDNTHQCQPLPTFRDLSSPFVCNIFHEMSLDPSNIWILGCGSHFCNFQVEDTFGRSVAFKTPRIDGVRHKEPKKYQARVRTETLIMEHLTSSPYILDLYANCGQAKIIPMGSHGSLYDQWVISQEHPPGTEWRDFMSPLTRLTIGYQVASAIADLHGRGEYPSIVHNDICHSQFILIDGIYKLNDYDLANFTNYLHGVPCKEPPHDMGTEVCYKV
mmetsp:Transcript_48269/g.71959  ORF Transcript_48269/g.71959 Transcript_48269/m.71959 type:complete len:293 (-) Transcript_48269:514-1392(-)